MASPVELQPSAMSDSTATFIATIPISQRRLAKAPRIELERSQQPSSLLRESSAKTDANLTVLDSEKTERQMLATMPYYDVREKLSDFGKY